MKKFRLYYIFDTLFRLFIIFLICFVWLRYFVRTFWLSIVLSCIATLMIDFGLKLIRDKKKNKKDTINKQKQKIENLINSLVFSDDKQVVDFFLTLAQKKHSATKKSSYVVVTHPNKKIVLYPYFIYRDFNNDDLIIIHNKIKKENADRVVVCTKKYDANVVQLAKQFSANYIILNGEQTYELLMEKYNTYPTEFDLIKEPKPTFREILAYALNKKRTKGYFFASFLLLLSCFIVPYKLYYVIMSSLLLILSFVSYLNPTFNKPKTQNILED